MDAVTALLLERDRGERGLRAMAVFSGVAHLVLVTALLLTQGQLFGRGAQAPSQVMNISLGSGAPGPSAGGVNPIGGRPVQREVPAPSARPEPMRPPAARTPEMALPVPGKKPPREKFGEVKTAPTDATGRTPTTGPRERFGTSSAETGGYGFGTGLSTGGGGTGGYLDVGNFCCPDYLETMMMRIQRNWESAQQVAGRVTIRFTIQRNGMITDVELERSSAYPGLDLTAQRALLNTRQLPPLPAAYPNPVLTVHLNFDYQR